MNNDVLSQEKFSEFLETVSTSENECSFTCNTLKKSYFTLHDRVAELEEQLESSYEEMQKLQKLNFDLIQRIDIYEPIHMDTQEDALKNALNYLSTNLNDESSFDDTDDERTVMVKYVVKHDIENKKYFIGNVEFPYDEQREPQINDMLLFTTEGVNIVFQLLGEDSGSYSSFRGIHYAKDKCQPTGLRVDENGKIVSILKK